jgi:hypothetical protein
MSRNYGWTGHEQSRGSGSEGGSEDRARVRLRRIEKSYNCVVRQCRRIARKEHLAEASQVETQSEMFGPTEMWGRGV